jgi:hypothetical protein
MKMTQRRQALTAEISPTRFQAMQSKIFAFYSTIEDAARAYRATGEKTTAKLKYGVLKNGR